ncbi:MAG: type VI secretion system tube protein Hcp [Myxococcales bacterium]|nr:type VI secretion system tube protein Hcp [Myxococcales bacterium]MDD9968500.1 type VI secretion system tube protein Hcp [Myxococcales bacterium]
MASNTFITIDGVEGEYKDGAIEVLEWRWGAANQGTTHDGGSGPAQVNLHVGNLEFRKPVDMSTPTLHRICVKGVPFSEATLTVTKSAEEPIPYLKLKMSEGVVVSVQGGGPGNTSLYEWVELNFPKFEFEYEKQGADASGVGGDAFKYDIPNRAEL